MHIIHCMNDVTETVVLYSSAFVLTLTGGFLGWRFAVAHMQRGWELLSSLRLRDSAVLMFVIIVTCVCLACFFLLRSNPGILWNLPIWVELYHLDFFYLFFLFEAAFLCSVVSCVALLTRGRRVWPAVSLACFLMVGFGSYLWDLQRPIADTLQEYHHDGIIMQTSGSSCAAASLANVLNYLGSHVTEKEAAADLKTSRIGTVSVRILVVARRRGFRAERFRLDASEWGRTPVPSVIFIDHPAAGREGHAVALMRRGNGIFEIWDPLAGRLFYSKEGLQRVWHGRGIHIWKNKENLS